MATEKRHGIPDPQQQEDYDCGLLFQRCPSCRWAASDLPREYLFCPQCGADILHESAIQFGGTTIRYDGKNFRLFDGEGREYTLWQYDIAAILRYSSIHAADFRRFTPRKTTPIRIPYPDDFGDYLRKFRSGKHS